MNTFVYTNNFSLPNSLCNEIIYMFETTKNGKYDGHTAGGINKNIKDTTDFLIPNEKIIKNIDTYTNQWIKIYNFLTKELINNIKEYLKKNIDLINKTHENTANDFELLPRKILINTIQIQKYLKNKGKYIWHNDSQIEIKNSNRRVITFLWYLNNVFEGGETCFVDNKIVPETGKLLLFPADWSYPHRGNVPISNDKYIMTGWVYIDI